MRLHFQGECISDICDVLWGRGLKSPKFATVKGLMWIERWLSAILFWLHLPMMSRGRYHSSTPFVRNHQVGGGGWFEDLAVILLPLISDFFQMLNKLVCLSVCHQASWEWCKTSASCVQQSLTNVFAMLFHIWASISIFYEHVRCKPALVFKLRCFLQSPWSATYFLYLVNVYFVTTKWSLHKTNNVIYGNKLVCRSVNCWDQQFQKNAHYVATSPLALRWMRDSPRRECARRTTPTWSSGFPIATILTLRRFLQCGGALRADISTKSVAKEWFCFKRNVMALPT